MTKHRTREQKIRSRQRRAVKTLPQPVKPEPESYLSKDLRKTLVVSLVLLIILGLLATFLKLGCGGCTGFFR